MYVSLIAAKHTQSSRYWCVYYARVDENLPRMSDCRISASSLFSGALPSVDRRMWLFFFAALLFLHSTQTHAHTRTHGRNTLHRRTADNLLLVVWPVPNPPPPGARNDVRHGTLLPPGLVWFRAADCHSLRLSWHESPAHFVRGSVRRARATATHAHVYLVI